MVSKVFVDTNVFVSIRDISDPTHTRVINLYQILKINNVKFYTSSDIIAESLTVISMKLGKKMALDFLKSVGLSVEEIFVDESIHNETRKFFKTVKSKNVSFVDCSSVVVMKRNKIDVSFSFDKHFKKMGVQLLEDVV